jgi:hypothetical protein
MLCFKFWCIMLIKLWFFCCSNAFFYNLLDFTLRCCLFWIWYNLLIYFILRRFFFFGITVSQFFIKPSSGSLGTRHLFHLLVWRFPFFRLSRFPLFFYHLINFFRRQVRMNSSQFSSFNSGKCLKIIVKISTIWSVFHRLIQSAKIYKSNIRCV